MTSHDSTALEKFFLDEMLEGLSRRTQTTQSRAFRQPIGELQAWLRE
ncbi:hypothetical protein ACVIGB_005220 [Bradyrhizobium sp. USDA 4341]